MGLKLVSEHLNGLKVFEPIVYEDERGFFMETWRADEFIKLGLPVDFIQDNHSRSVRGVLRGMHYQWDKPLGKLIRVTAGRAFLAEIDIRYDSPTLGKWFGIELSAENKRILWVPPGFANGFLSLTNWSEMQYKCTALWNKSGESNIRWNDPEIGIEWPIKDPLLSEKDANAQTLMEWLAKPESRKFHI